MKEEQRKNKEERKYHNCKQASERPGNIYGAGRDGAFGRFCWDGVGMGWDGMDGVSLEAEDGWERKRVCSFELIQRYFETTGLGSYSIHLSIF